MPICMANNTIQGGSNTFIIKNLSNTTVFEQGIFNYNSANYGKYINSNVPAFIVGRNVSGDPGWVNFASSGAWAKVNNYNTDVIINRGNYYNTSTTRFTAPISGPYIFIYTSYIYTAGYIHPAFTVNGDVNLRRGSSWKVRIRGYGMVANYQQDAQIEEIINLVAGDYVEVYMYASGASYNYPLHSLFEGIYIG